MFEVEKKQDGSTLVFTLKGVLDTPAAPSLEKVLEGAYDEAEGILFDCRELEFLTSAGLRILLEAQQEMEDRDKEMKLKSVCAEIMEVFDMTGFSDVLTIENE